MYSASPERLCGHADGSVSRRSRGRHRATTTRSAMRAPGTPSRRPENPGGEPDDRGLAPQRPGAGLADRKRGGARVLVHQSYATVHQLISTIRGRLRADRSAVDAVAACFPPGRCLCNDHWFGVCSTRTRSPSSARRRRTRAGDRPLDRARPPSSSRGRALGIAGRSRWSTRPSCGCIQRYRQSFDAREVIAGSSTARGSRRCCTSSFSSYT